MDWFTLTLLATTLACVVAVGIQMVRHPILLRVATRNASRRPKQTATVVAGLMVGTAIISAALVAGDSASYAIRGYVYQSLGDIDESVSVQGYPYFPQAAYEAIRADPNATFFDAVAAHTVWQSAVDDPASGQFEPNVAMVGFEPERDAGFGLFSTPGGGGIDGRSLGAMEAIATQHVAQALDLHVGDRVQLSFTPPIDPLLPEVTLFAGNVTAVAPNLPLPIPTPSPPGPPPPVPTTFPLPLPPPFPNHAGVSGDDRILTVNATAQRITLVALWQPVPPLDALPSSVTLTAIDPEGTAYTSGPDPSNPVWLNVTAPSGASLPAGNWTVRVSADASAVMPYRGVAVVAYPVYDLARLQERARALQAQYGDLADRVSDLRSFGSRHTANLTVVAVTDGGRGSLFDFQDALFLRMDTMQGLLGREGSINLIKLSNPGDREGGEAGTERALQILNATVERLKARHPDVPAYQSLEVRALKRDYVAVADQAGETLTNLLVFAGSLSIITGLLLILNIFTVLAEERRSELGMARAIGMNRRDLVRSFVFEGSLYAVVAAAAGALLGLALAAGMIAVLNAVIGQLAAKLTFPPIPYRPSLQAVAVAFAVGSLLTFGTIVGASVRKSRLNVVRAIRRIEEPEVTGGNPTVALALGLPILILGLVAAVMGWSGRPDLDLLRPVLHYRVSLQVFGPLAAVLGLAVMLRPHVKRSRLAPGLAGALAAYYTVNYFLLRRYDNMREANIVGPIRGVLLTLCVVVLVVHWNWLSRHLGRLLEGIPRLRAIAIPAVSYPLHKKFRTGLTLAMFSVVILSIGFFSIFGALFESDPSRQTGGYDIEGRPTLTVADLAPYDHGEVPKGLVTVTDRLTDYVSEDPSFITVKGGRVGNYNGDFRHNVFGYDEAFAHHNHFTLLGRDPAYPSDEAAYLDVLNHDDRVIVAYPYSTNSRNEDLSHRVGDTLELHLGERTVQLRIVGIQQQYHYTGIFLPRDYVKGLFPQTQDLYLFRITPGADPEAAARTLERNYRDIGLDAKATVVQVLQEQKSFRQVLGAMKLFLALGLVVGVLSLGIVTSRSVLERRQEIGMLRALGYTKRQVRRIFFTEMTYTLALGAVVGVGCAILVTYGLWFSVVRGLGYPYLVPWGELGLLIGASYVVAVIATLVPIGKSAKVAPAEALRYVE